jgi:hypothetical protein
MTNNDDRDDRELSNAVSVLVFDDSYFQPKDDDCDRRLSRASRKLIRGHLLRIFGENHEAENVWNLLEHWLPINRRGECPLLPSLDKHRIDEEHSIRIKASKNFAGAYPIAAIKGRPKESRPKTWFQCAYCGKTFSSRFYLDVHINHTHKVEERSTYCPASDWCQAVGLANCHDVALEDEPYYDRGGDGWSTDAKLVRHKFLKYAHSISCNEEDIQSDCHSILEACGITDPSQSWCSSLSCPQHRFGENIRDIWDRESEHLSGRLLLLVVLLLVMFSIARFVAGNDEVNNSNMRIPTSNEKQKQR